MADDDGGMVMITCPVIDGRLPAEAYGRSRCGRCGVGVWLTFAMVQEYQNRNGWPTCVDCSIAILAACPDAVPLGDAGQVPPT